MSSKSIWRMVISAFISNCLGFCWPRNGNQFYRNMSYITPNKFASSQRKSSGKDCADCRWRSVFCSKDGTGILPLSSPLYNHAIISVNHLELQLRTILMPRHCTRKEKKHDIKGLSHVGKIENLHDKISLSTLAFFSKYPYWLTITQKIQNWTFNLKISS